MSILKVDELQSRTSGNRITLPDVNNYPPYRNLIINGDMSIAQRGTTATALGNGDTGYHTIDRFNFREDGTPTYEFTMSQSTDTPTGEGFSKSLKLDCTTADTSLGSADALGIRYSIEAQNLQMLKYGTSNAETLTLSFWVKTNKTGTYTLWVYQEDGARNISKTYTVSSANTWEKKTINIDADISGTINNDNGNGLIFGWYLGAGTDFTSGTLNTSWNSLVTADRVSSSQVNLADNTANEWYITGVQLEAGDSATPFEHLPYDVNLDRCLRYYEAVIVLDDPINTYFVNGHYYNSTYLRAIYTYRKIMRATPSLDIVSGTDYYRFVRDNSSDNFDDFTLLSSSNKVGLLINTTDVSGTSGQAGEIRTNNASAYLAFDAEL